MVIMLILAGALFVLAAIAYAAASSRLTKSARATAGSVPSRRAPRVRRRRRRAR